MRATTECRGCAAGARRADTRMKPGTLPPACAGIGRRMIRSDHHESCRGVALTEFVLGIPLAFVLFIGILDFGRVFYAAMAVSNAARAGVQYGAWSNPSDFSGMRDAARAAGDASGIGDFTTVGACRYCKCSSGTGSCDSCSPSSGPSSDPTSDGCSVGSACVSGCPSGDAPQVYVSVTASKVFTTLFPYPAIPRTTTLNRKAVMRVQ